jgi:hypothetical protein
MPSPVLLNRQLLQINNNHHLSKKHQPIILTSLAKNKRKKIRISPRAWHVFESICSFFRDSYHYLLQWDPTKKREGNGLPPLLLRVLPKFPIMMMTPIVNTPLPVSVSTLAFQCPEE